MPPATSLCIDLTPTSSQNVARGVLFYRFDALRRRNIVRTSRHNMLPPCALFRRGVQLLGLGEAQCSVSRMVMRMRKNEAASSFTVGLTVELL